LTRFITLPELLWLSEQVTGIDAEVLERSCRLELADSALHAPQASFGGQDFYPDLIDKAAVLACHLAWNHPLLDGNKRASWACLVMFLDLNDVVWNPDPPDVDEAEAAMLSVAAHDVDEAWFAEWIRERTQAADSWH
jgi:death-on-curing protein